MADEQTNTETKPDVPEQAHPIDPGIAALAKGSDEGEGGGSSPGGTGGPGEDPAKLRKEAASYRRRLRETEAERDKLRARVEASDRLEVERQVGGDGGLADPGDLWLAVQLDDLRNDDGALDSEKVEAARDRVLVDRPHWRHQPTPQFDGGARESAVETKPSFGEALKKVGRRP